MPQVYLALSVLALLAVQTYQFSGVPSAHFGTFDFLELENTAYEVEITSTPVTELQIQEKESDVTYIRVLSKHGQLYSCSLPPTAALAEMEGESGPEIETLPNVTTLLEPLSEQECLVKTVGWWTYEYCHKKFVWQYHMEAGRIVGETKYLGFYEKETIWDKAHITRVKGLLDSFKDNMASSQTRAYHTAHYVNGTECDITQQPRSARVEMYCSVEGVDKVAEVREESTCNYTLTVQTPLLCQHPMLMPLGNSAPSHTLSCTPVVSQLDYEEYLLKRELIRQQEEKLGELQSHDDDTSDGEEESLFNANHHLLRKLVMSSITQLAEIAYDTSNEQNLYDSGTKVNEMDERLDASDASQQRRSDKWSNHRGEGGRIEERGSSKETEEDNRRSSHEGTDEGQKVSDKMKKMANDVKNTRRDSALESLLTNLAVTAQYIESLEDGDGTSDTSSESEEEYETGAPGDSEDDKHMLASSSDASMKGPPPAASSSRTGANREDSTSLQGGKARHSAQRSVSSEILAASELDEEEDEEEEEDEFELDPMLVREMEQHLEETLAKQLDTKDVTVKIITLPEDQLTDMEDGEEEGEDNGIIDEDINSDLSNAMSKFLDSLLNNEEPVSEDRQRQSNLEASYEHVWGKDRRKNGR